MPVLIREELDFDVNQMKRLADERIAMFTADQLDAFTTIFDAVKENKQLCLFLDARGTGLDIIFYIACVNLIYLFVLPKTKFT